MSLYYESATFLSLDTLSSPSVNNLRALSSRIYSKEGKLKSKPSRIYALVIESTKWLSVLCYVIDQAGLLTAERRKIPSRELAVLLVHDLLLSRGGIAAAQNHPLRVAVSRHKARLSAEFTKARIKAGFGSIEAWQAQMNQNMNAQLSNEFVRWIRINSLRTTFASERSDPDGVFTGWEEVSTLEELRLARDNGKILKIDEHVPNLVAIPAGLTAQITKSTAYKRGRVILQDKASCFPALLLQPVLNDGDIIDACAAPGNKTTHLAALISASTSVSDVSSASKISADKPYTTSSIADGDYESRRQKAIYAVERDRKRSETLRAGISKAGADHLVACLAEQDFTQLLADDERFRDVGAILLDPSCSGSGMNNRGSDSEEQAQVQDDNAADDAQSADLRASESGMSPERAERLKGLSNFQLTLLKHAFSFPSVRKVVYSTCSVHAEENEQVVVRALSSDIAKQRGWRILRREEQVTSLAEWMIRGSVDAIRSALDPGRMQVQVQMQMRFRLAGKDGGHRSRSKDGEDNDDDNDNDNDIVTEWAQACIRCDRGTQDGTMGFFVVGFVRDDTHASHAASNQVSARLHEEDGDRGEKWQAGVKEAKVEVEGGAEGEEEEEEEEEWQGIEDSDIDSDSDQ